MLKSLDNNHKKRFKKNLFILIKHNKKKPLTKGQELLKFQKVKDYSPSISEFNLANASRSPRVDFS
jgi:hypothetical protein